MNGRRLVHSRLVKKKKTKALILWPTFLRPSSHWTKCFLNHLNPTNLEDNYWFKNRGGERKMEGGRWKCGAPVCVMMDSSGWREGPTNTNLHKYLGAATTWRVVTVREQTMRTPWSGELAQISSKQNPQTLELLWLTGLLGCVDQPQTHKFYFTLQTLSFQSCILSSIDHFGVVARGVQMISSPTVLVNTWEKLGYTCRWLWGYMLWYIKKKGRYLM